MNSNESYIGSSTIEDLPDEVLEFILGLLPPYKDLHDCMQVSKRWRRSVLNVTKIKRRNLHKAISEFDITWHTVSPPPQGGTVTKRYSHAAAIHDNSMYVFGGCTSCMTTFNDLWKLDLSKRQWARPVTMGSYPSPKACCSMVCYKDCLVLFGGWTYPPSYPLHQSWHLFNELHMYDIPGNRWTSINTENSPPPVAGHSVSIHGDWMIMFGGLQKANNVVHSTKSNDLWKLNLKTLCWYKQETPGHCKPAERYGQSQIKLNATNILIMGGCGGPSLYHTDIWRLNMAGNVWKWSSIEIRNSVNGPPNIWCNPVCKVGDKIIVLSRSRQSSIPTLTYYSKGVWLPYNSQEERRSHPKTDDRDENVNGKRGTLRNQRRENPAGNNAIEPQPGPSTSNAGRVPTYKTSPMELDLSAFNNSQANRQLKVDLKTERRLGTLKRLEERMKRNQKVKDILEPPDVYCAPTPKKLKRNVLGMYVLDISHILDETPFVSWMPPKNNGALTQGPEETVLYTLMEGKAELIMFGGIQKDANTFSCTTNLSNQVSNSVHFITAPKYII